MVGKVEWRMLGREADKELLKNVSKMKKKKMV